MAGNAETRDALLQDFIDVGFSKYQADQIILTVEVPFDKLVKEIVKLKGKVARLTTKINKLTKK